MTGGGRVLMLWDRRRLSLITAVIVFMSTFYLGLAILPQTARATTLFVGGSGSDNFTTIQDALNASNPGDTIFIYSGTYTEELTIAKPVTLIGEDSSNTSVHGSRDEGTIRVESDWVNISGLRIVGFGMDFKTGLVLSSSNNCMIMNNDIAGEDGMGLSHSSFNRFMNNTIYGYYSAVLVSDSHNNYFINNSIYGMKAYGILMGISDNTLISNNNISDSAKGISIWGSKNNEIIWNTFWRNPGGGLRIHSSSHITVTDNEMIENGIYIEGDELEHWNTHVIEPSNMINGKPAIYWKNATGGTISTDSGEVILANCTGVTVMDQNTRDTDVGIMLGFSKGNTIVGNNASIIWGSWPYDSAGIFLDRSEENTVANNVASNHLSGIRLLESGNNTIMSNNASGSLWGIYIENSVNNNIICNNISDNSDGVRTYYSNNNTIFHNNFLVNGDQAVEAYGLNQWDNGYPSGGNYWSDYTGVDVKTGPDQDLPGSDGLGDSPYVINANSRDNYPLMMPMWKPIPSLPTAPRNLQASAGDQQVFLTWEPPSFSGDSPVSNYKIYRGNASGTEIFLVMVGSVLSYLDAGLENDKTYYYQVSAVNSEGEGPRSNEASATPTGPQPNQPPTCTIVDPTLGEIVSGTYTLAGSASDSDGTVEKVEVKIDDDSWIQATGTTSWSYDWDTESFADGEHTIYARSYDGLNFSQEANVTVTVDNQEPPGNEVPVCSITAPTAGETVSGWVAIEGSSHDPDGSIQRVEMRIDDGAWFNAIGTDTWSHEWNTTTASNGEHTIYARSFDGQNYSSVVSVTILVDNPGPPTDGQPQENWIWIGVASTVIVLALVLLSAYVLMRKKKTKEDKLTKPPPEEPL